MNYFLILDIATIVALTWTSTIVTYGGYKSIATTVIKSTFVLLALGGVFKAALDYGYVVVPV